MSVTAVRCNGGSLNGSPGVCKIKSVNGGSLKGFPGICEVRSVQWWVFEGFPRWAGQCNGGSLKGFPGQFNAILGLLWVSSIIFKSDHRNGGSDGTPSYIPARLVQCWVFEGFPIRLYGSVSFMVGL